MYSSANAKQNILVSYMLRIFHAVYVVQFLRIWRQWLHDNSLSEKSFVTKNAWDGLEIDLILLIKMAMLNKAENSYIWNSQPAEGFFRQARSFTGIESTIVNFTMKTLLFRIQLEERLMRDLSISLNLKFPKILKREKLHCSANAILTRNDIETIIDQAMNASIIDAENIGMRCKEVNPENFLKTPVIQSKKKASKDSEKNKTEDEDSEAEDIETENFLEVGEIRSDDANEEDILATENFSLKDLVFTDETSGIFKNCLIFKAFYPMPFINYIPDRKLAFPSFS